MTISMFLSFTRANASSSTRAFFLTIEDAFFVSLSATCEIRIALPARRSISPALRLSTSQTPPPTTPMPRRPTWMGFILACFISLQPELQVALHVRPLRGEDAVHHRVPDRAVASRPVVADRAVLLRAQRLDGALRAEVEVVRPQPDDLAAQFLEAIFEQLQLARGVDVRTLAALRVPGVADLDAVGGGNDVVVARAADQLARLQVAHHPGQHVPGLLALERGVDVGLGLA